MDWRHWLHTLRRLVTLDPATTDMADPATPPTSKDEAEKQDEDITCAKVRIFEPPDVVAVCEFGNVILVADNEFQVSTCILASGSSAFCCLFQDHFAEGIKIKEANDNGQVLRLLSKTGLTTS